MIRAVVFDLGQVLSSPANLFADSAASLGVTAEAYEAQYWTNRGGWDSGGPDADYWGPLLRNLGVEPSEQAVANLARLDSEIWAGIRESAWQLLRDCRTAGMTVAVLSNAPHALKDAVEASPWRADVDHLFVSAPMGVAKPDPAIYEAAQDVLGLEGHEIAFIDDRQPNVDGALAAGWQAHLWVDDADTRAWLESVGVL